jgi:predicted GNAT family acetyltransferase
MNNTLDLKILHLKTNAQNLETWVAYDNKNHLAIGHIFMCIETNNKIKFLDAWVHDEHRRKGIYRNLWDTRWEYVKEHYKNKLVYAWCKDASLPLLIEKGFTTGEICTYVEFKIE